VSAGREDAKQSLERIMAGFKGACTRRIWKLPGGSGTPVWQKSFHDEIIRDDRHLTGIRQYIADNPAQWKLDKENPHNP
jgi:hypothetical protein